MKPPTEAWMIVDADGHEVCNADGSAGDCANIVGMILVAVNTCGGFRAALQGEKP